MIEFLLFVGFEPRDLWHSYISNDAAEFVNIIVLIFGTLGLLVLFGLWWERR